MTPTLTILENGTPLTFAFADPQQGAGRARPAARQ